VASLVAAASRQPRPVHGPPLGRPGRSRL